MPRKYLPPTATGPSSPEDAADLVTLADGRAESP